jgi:hypothetical protein
MITALERYGEPGVDSWSGKKHWEGQFPLSEGGRVGSHWPPRPETLFECLIAIGELAQAGTCDAAVRAYEIASHIKRLCVLPDTTWVVFSLYLPDSRGRRFGSHNGQHQRAIWSAHEFEEDAALWRNAWHQKWERRRYNDYLTMYAQMPGVAPHYLRRPHLTREAVEELVGPIDD